MTARAAAAIVVALSTLVACRATREPAVEPLLVFVASSLEDAMAEIAAVYRRDDGVEVALNAAGSNVLAQQIRSGAPADVLVSADAAWPDALERDGLLEPGTRRDLLTNRMVVVAHPGAGFALDRLEDIGALGFTHLSLADPDAVPAGRYAKSILAATTTAAGTAWDEVADRVAPAPDVRAALALVAAERDVVGIVYRSDAIGEPGVEVLLQIDREPEPPIRYVAAVVRRESRRATAAEALLDFLDGETASEIFRRHGFLPLE
jgi:molybdate transport system substrate-binding protein